LKKSNQCINVFSTEKIVVAGRHGVIDLAVTINPMDIDCFALVHQKNK